MKEPFPPNALVCFFIYLFLGLFGSGVLCLVSIIKAYGDSASEEQASQLCL